MGSILGRALVACSPQMLCRRARCPVGRTVEDATACSTLARPLRFAVVSLGRLLLRLSRYADVCSRTKLEVVSIQGRRSDTTCRIGRWASTCILRLLISRAANEEWIRALASSMSTTIEWIANTTIV